MQISRALAVWVLLAPAAASAEPEHGGGSVVIGARGIGFPDADHEPDFIGTAGLDLRGAIAPGSFPAGIAAGAGYQLGASLPGGFAYEAHLMPLGIAGFVDGIGWIAVTGGGDLSGVTTRVPFAARVIAEARLELQLPGPFHFAGFARPAWLAVDERENGSKSMSFADELEAGVGFRIGGEERRRGIDTSRGLFVGGVMREWLSERGFGIVLGYTVDGQFGG